MRLRRTIESTERFREDPFGHVINYSKKSFSKPEYKLLGYNLNYIPTPNNIDKKEIAQDIKNFGRRVKLRDHFGVSTMDKPAFKYTDKFKFKYTTPTEVYEQIIQLDKNYPRD